jgi:hypothetical protein
VSPEMKDQKNFLFSISGVTCSELLKDLGYPFPVNIPVLSLKQK